jgi:hypothetical protein
MRLRVTAAAVNGVFGQDDDVCLGAGFAGQGVARHRFFMPAYSDYSFSIFKFEVVLEQE